MASAHINQLRNIRHTHTNLTSGIFFQAQYVIGKYQGVAVDTREQVGKFLFQLVQGFINDHFASNMPDGHLLLVGLEIPDVLYVDQFHAFVCSCAQMSAPVRIDIFNRGYLHAIQANTVGYRTKQFFSPHGFK